MEDLTVSEVSHSPFPTSVHDDDPPDCKRRKLEDDSFELEKGDSIASEQKCVKESDEAEASNNNCPNTQVSRPIEAEGKPTSPVHLVSIDFDSIIGDDEDESDDEIETQVDNKIIDLSEEETELEGNSDSSEEVEVIKEERKPEKKNRRKTANQRRNIKELIGQEHLDERTVAAQKEEWARRERIAAKQKSLGMSHLPLSMEQIMERFSSASSMVSVTPVESESQQTAKTSNSRQQPAEHEVLTISSDDEDCTPCYETSSKTAFQQQPPRLISTSHLYDAFVSDSHSSRSRYSGGTMLVNKRDRSDLTFGDELEEKAEDEEDDDDCVVLSPPPPDAIDDEKDEDAFNVPDGLGRVLVNVLHPPEDPDIFLAPQIARAVKPHQIGGIRFMYENIVESLERYNNSSGFGCILAHSMGLGKTIQAAAFCDIFLNYTGANTVLVIVPINTIQNWLNEFNHWLPPAKTATPSHTTSSASSMSTKKRGRKCKVESEEQLPLEKSEDTLPTSLSPETSHSSGEDGDEDSKSKSEQPLSQHRSFEIFVLNETVKNLNGRGKIISDWVERRGVLLIGYEMYRMLALKRLRKTNKKKKPFDDLQEDKSACKAFEEEAILDQIYSCLVKPGPDLVICDEGHRIKNSGASISQALKAIKTRRRIVLTGYPLQNNLMEYHCMCDFIRPNYLGNKAEFSNMFERPITNGQCVDSTIADKRLMQFRSHVLHSLLEGFVQRRSHLVLQRALPRKEEWVFLVKMTPIQTVLYKEFITHVRLMAELGNSTPNPIKAFAICCKIWNHPDVLYNVVVKKDKDKEQAVLEDLEDLAEEEGLKWKKGGNKKREGSNNGSTNGFFLPDEEDSFPGFGKWTDTVNSCSEGALGKGSGRDYSIGGPPRLGKDNDSSVPLEWCLNGFKDYVPNVLQNGTKFELLFIIIRETVIVGDKLLVFSQSLFTLNLMESFLASEFNWVKGKEYFRLDGSTTGLERERLIKAFNINSDVHVFLVSTRAGSLGINLIGANRVVVFDSSWNPCNDGQAVCRIYRYGQKKRCHIYRFVADCTLEKKIYDRQITKRGMANRVVDEMNPDAHFSTKDLSGSLLLELDDFLKLQSLHIQHDASHFDDPVIQKLLLVGGDKITKAPFEHESLLIDRKEKKLSKAERRLALRNYEMEKKAIINQGLNPSSASRNSYNNQYTRVEYSQHVPIAPAPPGYIRKDISHGSNNYGNRNNSNTFGYEKGVPHPGYPMPGYFPEFDRMNNGPPLPMEDVRRKGISAQGIVLKKDSFLVDPEGGPDIYLKAGQKVHLLRSSRGTYLKLSNGRFIVIRHRMKGAAQIILETVPTSQDLTKDQIYIVINSILRPHISSTLGAQAQASQSQQQQQQAFQSNRYFPPPTSSMGSYNYPPMSVPIPATYNYSNCQQNEQNLQITNQRNSSGGDVTIWRKDGSNPLISSTRNISQNRQDNLIPDIEVIKINPEGENERIEPTQLESELLHHRHMQEQHQHTFNNFPSYLGKALSSSSSIYPSGNDDKVSSILHALGRNRSDEIKPKYKAPYYQPSSSSSSTSTLSSPFSHLQQPPFRNTQSPLEQLRNSVSQLPNYKLSEDVVIDYLDNSSNSNSSSIPDSLYSKLLKPQHALTPTSSTPFGFQSQQIRMPESNHQFQGNNSGTGSSFFDESTYMPSSSLGRPNNFQQYYTNGGSVKVNEKPTKAIFTPAEQEILDRHRKELL